MSVLVICSVDGKKRAKTIDPTITLTLDHFLAGYLTARFYNMLCLNVADWQIFLILEGQAIPIDDIKTFRLNYPTKYIEIVIEDALKRSS
jgi:hypothetical protein